VSAFFEAYYGGMECLVKEEDFYELAMSYFSRAKEMGVRYCEVMFDPQAYTVHDAEFPSPHSCPVFVALSYKLRKA
jgi:adenosine deaminase